MRNSINEMINVLRSKPFLTENELTWAAFNYDRNISRHSNKKYADMLRRGLRKGIIKRVEANVKGKRATFFYYIPDQEDWDFGNFHPDSLVKEDKVGIDAMDSINKELQEAFKVDELKSQKAEIKELINCIVKTHNNYVMWENSEITKADFILNLLEIVSDYSVRKVIPFYGNGWVSYLRNNFDNELPKTSSGSFYTSLIDFDNFFLEGVFEMILEQGMLEPTDERVDYLSEFAWREYDKIRPSLYTLHYIDNRDKDIPGFEGTLNELNNLTSEFRTYIGAPGNELV